MRLLVRQIYRAFPELDRFPDEKCARFVAAANRGIARALARVVILGIAGLISAALATAIGIASGSGVASLMTKARILSTQQDWATISLQLTGLVIAAFPCFVSVWYLRDFLLRRRIEFVLHTRGNCTGCGYILVGIPVNRANLVVCPECGMETEVDESLGELTSDAGGGKRFTPSERAPVGPRWLKPISRETRRRVLRRGAKVLVALIVACAVLYGGYEWLLRSQAVLAKRSAPTTEDYQKLFERVKLRPRSGPDTVETVVAEVCRKVAPVDALAEFSKWNTTGEFARWASVVMMVGRSTETEQGSDFDDRTPSIAVAGLGVPPSDPEVAIRMFNECKRSGAFDSIDLLAESQIAFLPPRTVPPSAWRMNSTVVSPLVNRLTAILKINTARLNMAIVADDPLEFAKALRSSLAMRDQIGSQAEAMSKLTAWDLELSCLRWADRALTAHRSQPWIDAVKCALASHLNDDLDAPIFEGERLVWTTAISDAFSDPAGVRIFSGYPGANVIFGYPVIRSFWDLGTFQGNIDALNRTCTFNETQIAQEPFERTPEPALSGLTLADMAKYAHSSLIVKADALRCRRRGMIVRLALEEFTLKHGDYPKTLSELVPEFLAKLPIDPWSGKPFGYKKFAAGGDALGRPCLLYSVGPDGIDQGGAIGFGDVLINPSLRGDAALFPTEP